MAEQDNETFQNRVREAVIAAVLEASRVNPNTNDMHLDMNDVFEGIGAAMAVLTFSVANLAEDREKRVAIMEASETEIVKVLRLFTEKLRTGEIEPPPPERPKPRLVK